MSLKYGKEIYDADNRQFPYYVREWDACVNESELKAGGFPDDNYCPTCPRVDESELPTMPTNWEMTKKYGIQICDSDDPDYPYYVPEWDDYHTEEEIANLMSLYWETLEIGNQ